MLKAFLQGKTNLKALWGIALLSNLRPLRWRKQAMDARGTRPGRIPEEPGWEASQLCVTLLYAACGPRPAACGHRPAPARSRPAVAAADPTQIEHPGLPESSALEQIRTPLGKA